MEVQLVQAVKDALNCSGMLSTCADEINTHRLELQEGFSSLFADSNDEPVIKSVKKAIIQMYSAPTVKFNDQVHR